MYSAKAKLLRRCTATKADGSPCKNWSLWESDQCSAHAPALEGEEKRKKPVCRCAAYQWPHRPGGGLCRWPDAPIEKCLTPAGTHDGPRWARTLEAHAYGRRYVEMMKSALGGIGGTRTGKRRGRPSKARREALNTFAGLVKAR